MSSERAASPAPSAHSAGTSVTASQVQLPAWVSSLGGGSANHAALSATDQSSLSEDQRAKLEQARSFARQLTAKLKRDAIEAAKLAQQQLALKNLPVHCRVHVNGIGPNMNEALIKTIFTQCGYVKNVSLPLDTVTRKHRGFCYVDYDTAEAVSVTFAKMNNVHCDGKNFKIGRPANYPTDGTKNMPPPPKNRIYVSNINEMINEEMIKEVFSPFGEIEAVVMPPDTLTKTHKGYAYIEYQDPNAAQNAVQAMNGIELSGLPLHIVKAVIGVPLPEGMDSLKKKAPPPSLPASVLAIANRITSKITGVGDYDGDAAASYDQDMPNQAKSEPASDEPMPAAPKSDEPESYSATPTPIHPEPPSTPTASEEALAKMLQEQQAKAQQQQEQLEDQQKSQQESSVIVLRNMVAPDEVDDDLRDEVQEECEKFGPVDQVIVKTGETDVEIFVKFKNHDAAQIGINKLHGRWFGGRQVVAEFYSEASFSALL